MAAAHGGLHGTCGDQLKPQWVHCAENPASLSQTADPFASRRQVCDAAASEVNEGTEGAQLARADTDPHRQSVTGQAPQERERAELARFRSWLAQADDEIWCFEFQPPISTDSPTAEQIQRIEQGVLTICSESQARNWGATESRKILGRTWRELAPAHGLCLSTCLTSLINDNYRATGAVEHGPDGGAQSHFRITGIVEHGLLLCLWGTSYPAVDARPASPTSLDGRERALHTLYHRMGNDLQLVTSLLSLSSRGGDTESALTTAINRVHAMSGVYDIVRRDGREEIPVDVYVHKLTTSISKTFNPCQVEVKVGLDGLLIDIDRAAPFGLLLTELLTKALEAGSRARETPQVELLGALKPDGSLQLTVRFAETHVPSQRGDEESSDFARALCRQLRAELESQADQFVLHLPLRG